MDTEVVIAIVSLIEGIGVAIIGVIVANINKKNEQYRLIREQKEAVLRQRQEEKEKQKQAFDTAKLDLLFATANGTDVLLQAAHGDKINGNVNDARKSISKAKAECNRITNKVTVENL